MKHEGITLIALVVTIVVLLILAGVSIGTVFDDNGIIKKAQEAANKTEESLINEQEALNSLLNDMNEVIDGSGGSEGGDGGETTTGEINEQIVWSTGTATLTLTVTEPTITIQYKKNSDQSWTSYTTPITSLMHGDKVYVKGVKNGETVIEERQIDILDADAPTVTITNTSSTTNSISATATATDDGAGLGSSPNYTFYLKKSMEQDSAYVQVGSGTTASVTKGDLEQNTAYMLKVEVSDIAGNKGQATKEINTSKIADAGDGLVNGAIVASKPTWSGGTASTTLSTSTGFTIQYQKNGTSGSWSPGTKVTGLHHNDTVFARLTDGKNYGGEASITILDTVRPRAAEINLSATRVSIGGNITATVTLNDNESGVNIAASKWIYNTNSGNIGTNSGSYTNTFSSNGQTINLKATTAGKYYLHVLTVDNAGNKKETISNAVIVGDPTIEDIEVGDYVRYTAGGFSSWRVLYEANNSSINNGTSLQIVSAYPVKEVTMGVGVEGESFNLKNDPTYIQVKNEYNNYISMINSEVEDYLNPTYATDVRSLGTLPNDKNYDTTEYYSDPEQTWFEYYFGEFKLEMGSSKQDVEQLQNAKMYLVKPGNVSSYIFLGDRSVTMTKLTTTTGQNMFWCGPKRLSTLQGPGMDSIQETFTQFIVKRSQESMFAHEFSSGIAPVVSLKPNLKVVGGYGTEQSPWELSL